MLDSYNLVLTKQYFTYLFVVIFTKTRLHWYSQMVIVKYCIFNRVHNVLSRLSSKPDMDMDTDRTCHQCSKTRKIYS